MNCRTQFLLLLWKHFTYRIRHPAVIFLELVCPIGLIVIVATIYKYAAPGPTNKCYHKPINLPNAGILAFMHSYIRAVASDDCVSRETKNYDEHHKSLNNFFNDVQPFLGSEKLNESIKKIPDHFITASRLTNLTNNPFISASIDGKLPISYFFEGYPQMLRDIENDYNSTKQSNFINHIFVNITSVYFLAYETINNICPNHLDRFTNVNISGQPIMNGSNTLWQDYIQIHSTNPHDTNDPLMNKFLSKFCGYLKDTNDYSLFLNNLVKNINFTEVQFYFRHFYEAIQTPMTKQLLKQENRFQDIFQRFSILFRLSSAIPLNHKIYEIIDMLRSISTNIDVKLLIGVMRDLHDIFGINTINGNVLGSLHKLQDMQNAIEQLDKENTITLGDNVFEVNEDINENDNSFEINIENLQTYLIKNYLIERQPFIDIFTKLVNESTQLDSIRRDDLLALIPQIFINRRIFYQFLTDNKHSDNEKKCGMIIDSLKLIKNNSIYFNPNLLEFIAQQFFSSTNSSMRNIDQYYFHITKSERKKIEKKFNLNNFMQKLIGPSNKSSNILTNLIPAFTQKLFGRGKRDILSQLSLELNREFEGKKLTFAQLKSDLINSTYVKFYQKRFRKVLCEHPTFIVEEVERISTKYPLIRQQLLFSTLETDEPFRKILKNVNITSVLEGVFNIFQENGKTISFGLNVASLVSSTIQNILATINAKNDQKKGELIMKQIMNLKDLVMTNSLFTNHSNEYLHLIMNNANDILLSNKSLSFIGNSLPKLINDMQNVTIQLNGTVLINNYPSFLKTGIIDLILDTLTKVIGKTSFGAKYSKLLGFVKYIIKNDQKSMIIVEPMCQLMLKGFLDNLNPKMKYQIGGVTRLVGLIYDLIKKIGGLRVETCHRQNLNMNIQYNSLGDFYDYVMTQHDLRKVMKDIHDLSKNNYEYPFSCAGIFNTLKIDDFINNFMLIIIPIEYQQNNSLILSQNYCKDGLINNFLKISDQLLMIVNVLNSTYVNQTNVPMMYINRIVDEFKSLQNEKINISSIYQLISNIFSDLFDETKSKYFLTENLFHHNRTFFKLIEEKSSDKMRSFFELFSHYNPDNGNLQTDSLLYSSSNLVSFHRQLINYTDETMGNWEMELNKILNNSDKVPKILENFIEFSFVTNNQLFPNHTLSEQFEKLIVKYFHVLGINIDTFISHNLNNQRDIEEVFCKTVTTTENERPFYNFHDKMRNKNYLPKEMRTFFRQLLSCNENYSERFIRFDNLSFDWNYVDSFSLYHFIQSVEKLTNSSTVLNLIPIVKRFTTLIKGFHKSGIFAEIMGTGDIFLKEETLIENFFELVVDTATQHLPDIVYKDVQFVRNIWYVMKPLIKNVFYDVRSGIKFNRLFKDHLEFNEIFRTLNWTDNEMEIFSNFSFFPSDVIIRKLISDVQNSQGGIFGLVLKYLEPYFFSDQSFDHSINKKEIDEVFHAENWNGNDYFVNNILKKVEVKNLLSKFDVNSTEFILNTVNLTVNDIADLSSASTIFDTYTEIRKKIDKYDIEKLFKNFLPTKLGLNAGGKPTQNSDGTDVQNRVKKSFNYTEKAQDFLQSFFNKLGDSMSSLNKFAPDASFKSSDISDKTLEKELKNLSTTACQLSYTMLHNETFGDFIWSLLKPLLFGKILYSPETSLTNKIIKNMQNMMDEFFSIDVLLRLWLDIYDRTMANWEHSMKNFHEFTKLTKNNPVLYDILRTVLHRHYKLAKESNIDTIDELEGKMQEIINFTRESEVLKNREKFFTLSVYTRIIQELMSCTERDRYLAAKDEDDIRTKREELSKNRKFLAVIKFTGIDIQNSDEGDDGNGIKFLNDFSKFNELPTHLNYTISMDLDNAKRTDTFRDALWRPGRDNNPLTDLGMLRAFIHIQDTIERGIIKTALEEDGLDAGKENERSLMKKKLLMNKQSVNPDSVMVAIHQIPYPCFTGPLNEIAAYATFFMFPILITLMWTGTLALSIKNYVYETEHGIVETMKVMGLVPIINWLAWVFDRYIGMLLVTICVSFVITQMKMLTLVNILVLMLVIAVFAFASLMMCFMISSLFHKTNTAALAAIVFYILSYLPYIMMMSFQSKFTFWIKILVDLSATTAFCHASNYIMKYEQQSIRFTWGLMLKTPETDDDTYFLIPFLMMIFDSFLYMFAAWYIQTIYPGGKNQQGLPFYFIFTKSYWHSLFVDFSSSYRERHQRKRLYSHYSDSNKDSIIQSHHNTIKSIMSINPSLKSNYDEMDKQLIESAYIHKRAASVNVEAKKKKLQSHRRTVSFMQDNKKLTSSHSSTTTEDLERGELNICGELDERKNGNHENEPHYLPVGISIRHMSKAYTPKKTIVNKLSFNFYEGQITALLGHNGAGKTTTINVLTGNCMPSKGTALIYGRDVRKSFHEIRKNVGICPQFDVLFDYMTVREHLDFFGQLKNNLCFDAVQMDIDDILKKMGLLRFSNDKARILSGGVRRRLSVAIAFVAGSKTVILDEPSSGVDPCARRAIWDVIFKYRQGRTILLTTHHLDEADTLSDRIAIIHKGQLQCSGSPMYLKSKFGPDYQFVVDFGEDVLEEQKENLLNFIQMNIRDSQLHEKMGKYTYVYLLPSKYRYRFANFFRQIEDNKEKFLIQSYGIQDTTLEEVFIRVTETAAKVSNATTINSDFTTDLFDHNQTSIEIGDTDENSSKNESSESNSTIIKKKVINNKKNLRSSLWQLRQNQFKAILYKRFCHSLRNYKSIIFQILLPIIFFLLAMIFSTISPAQKPQKEKLINRDLYPGGNEFVTYQPNLNSTYNPNELISSYDQHMDNVDFGWPSCNDMMELTFYSFVKRTLKQSLKSNSTTGLINFDVILQEFDFKEELEKLSIVMPSRFKVDRCLPINTFLETIEKRKMWMNNSNSQYSIDISSCNCRTTPSMKCNKIDIGTGNYTQTMNNVDKRSSDVNITDLSLYNDDLQNYLIYTYKNFIENRYGGLSFEYFNRHDRRHNETTDNKNKFYWKVWFNNKAYYSQTVYLNMMNNILLNLSLKRKTLYEKLNDIIEQYKALIDQRNFLSISTEESINSTNYLTNIENFMNWIDELIQPRKGSKLKSISIISAPLSVQGAQLTQMSLVKTTKDVGITLVILCAFSFIPAGMVVYLVNERATYQKRLQFVYGIPPVLYWGASFLWDYGIFLLTASGCIVLIYLFNITIFTRGSNMVGLVTLILLYGWAAIPQMYVFSKFFNEPNNAFLYAFIISLLLSISTTLVNMILTFFELPEMILARKIISKIFMIIPQFLFGDGLIRMMKTELWLSILNSSNSDDPKEFDLFEMTILGYILVALAINGVVMIIIIILSEYSHMWHVKSLHKAYLHHQNLMEEQKPKLLNRSNDQVNCALTNSSNLSVSDYVTEKYGTNHLNNFHYSATLNQNLYEKSSRKDDDDVIKEKEYVHQITKNGLPPDNVIAIRDLRKVFRHGAKRRQLVAVKTINFGVDRGDCFGLLGVNGAGKTTTFKMLTGEITPTYGECLFRGNVLYDFLSKRKFKNSGGVGYCPQFDAIDNFLTAEENLKVYSWIKGITNIDDEVAYYLKSLRMEGYAKQIAGDYSGGMRRKLSLAVALIGQPDIVLLDEPTNGMDPGARRIVWKELLRQMKTEKRALILTSHSMAECEVLCSRIAIMVNGEFLCLGSANHLKNKFGNGYIVQLRVKSQNHVPNAKTLIQRHFKTAKIKDIHGCKLEYQIRQSSDNKIELSKIFRIIEQNKKIFNISDYSVTQTTMDQVFINFAKQQSDGSGNAATSGLEDISSTWGSKHLTEEHLRSLRNEHLPPTSSEIKTIDEEDMSSSSDNNSSLNRHSLTLNPVNFYRSTLDSKIHRHKTSSTSDELFSPNPFRKYERHGEPSTEGKYRKKSNFTDHEDFHTKSSVLYDCQTSTINSQITRLQDDESIIEEEKMHIPVSQLFVNPQSLLNSQSPNIISDVQNELNMINNQSDKFHHNTKM
ncbi:hypothetical protein SNEBB_001773 [Seison nebaliae]|nr:hypothetical protein SNEBB_001773 [Seison nebaliae]